MNTFKHSVMKQYEDNQITMIQKLQIKHQKLRKELTKK